MSKQNQLALIGVPDYNITVTLEPSALEKRTELLESAALVVHVANPEEQAEAVQIAGGLKKWSKEIETTREDLTKPILNAQRTLKAYCDKAREPADKEAKRLEALVSDFNIQQARARQAAIDEQNRLERVRLAEIAKREREEKEKADEIERQRVAAAQAALNAKTAKARAAAQAEADRLAEQQFQDELAQEFVQPEPEPIYVAPPEVVKPKGAAVKEVIEFEVVDIEAFYKAYPGLCKIEVLKQSVNYFLATPGVNINNIPGLRCWTRNTVSVRSTAAA